MLYSFIYIFFSLINYMSYTITIIRNTLLVLGSTLFLPSELSNSLWHRLNMVLETFFRLWAHFDVASQSHCRFADCTSTL